MVINIYCDAQLLLFFSGVCVMFCSRSFEVGHKQLPYISDKRQFVCCLVFFSSCCFKIGLPRSLDHMSCRGLSFALYVPASRRSLRNAFLSAEVIGFNVFIFSGWATFHREKTCLADSRYYEVHSFMPKLWGGLMLNIPNLHIAVDEQMTCIWYRVSFIQYMPNNSRALQPGQGTLCVV